MDALSRRCFLQSALAAPLAASIPMQPAGSSIAAAGAQSRPGFLFGYDQVQLLDGPLRQQFDENHRFFLHLSDDRLLKIYRQRSGLPAPGPDMGGWYDDFCPGASFGQYLSALARFAAATGSNTTKAKVHRLVKGYAETITPDGKTFVNLRYPAYTYDKLVCGLLDANTWAGDPAAVQILEATTSAALPHMPERALSGGDRRQRHYPDETFTWDECYTLAENLFLAFERTGNSRYRALAPRYLLDRTFFDPLAAGENVLPGLHAYSHVNALSSGMQGYLKLGDTKYLRAVNNAVDFLWKDQSYATGGWGPNESFVHPGRGELGKSVASTHRSFETPCGSYAHIKLMRYLLTLTGDARYGDSMEQVVYNTVLGAKPILEDGSSFYYSDYHHSAQKTYRRVIPGAKWAWDLDDKWPCCSGTLPQVAADYGISSYMGTPDGINVNLYVPSTLQWSQRGVRCLLRQTTEYPLASQVSLAVTTASPTAFTIGLRVPGWAGPNTEVAVNGRHWPAEPRPGHFLALQRTWRTGDRIELAIDQCLRSIPVDLQTPDQVAVLRGPLVLFAVADQQPRLTAAALKTLRLTPSSQPGWLAEWGEDKVPVRPFFALRDETYQTYWGLEA